MNFRTSGLTVLSFSLVLAVGCNNDDIVEADDSTGSGTEENATFDTGDGDGDTGDGDGDGDGDTGDGDGDTGDGDGDTGDGDGDTGDGDGDTGDGDGDTGDGDGDTGDGDGDTGDGDGDTGDGDGDTGDGDGDTGDGDGDTGDGDGDTGDGDGDTGDGDGDTGTGDGDGDTGDGDGDTGTGDGDGDTGTGDGDGDTGDGDGDTGTGDGDGDTGTGDGDGDTGTGDGDGDTGDGDGDTGDGDGDTGEPDEAPFVISTSPAVGEEGVAGSTTITVTFSEPMDPATVTTNSENKDCSGAIGVSHDDFFGCVQMTAQPTSDDNTTFTLTPVAPLWSMTEYRIRVTNEVTDAGGTPMEAFYAPLETFLTRYYHTIEIDGVNDFEPDETFNSSTLGHVGYIAWDEDYLYLGMNSPDLAADDPSTFLVAYLGGLAGTNTGVLYNTQQPVLPFDARWHLRWKASDDFGGALEWDGGEWFDPGFGPIAGSEDVASSESFVEMRIAWGDLEWPDLIDLHLGMLREEADNEACWAAVPAGSYVDGYDPDYAQYFQFDVLASMYPSEYEPI
ncbi:MAG: Ig-like domain-containing protein [Enhygromyxa sp.]